MSSSTWPIHVDPDHLYFITASAIGHKHIFRREVIRRILVDSLNTGRILGQYALFAFVIMPNHLHILIRCLGDFTPADVVREYKKATANLIIRQFEAEQNHRALPSWPRLLLTVNNMQSGMQSIRRRMCSRQSF
ncbi:MAG: transposase [Caldilineaceae bacterium]|nr:transposase [Caldilineaceae bacterium]